MFCDTDSPHSGKNWSAPQATAPLQEHHTMMLLESDAKSVVNSMRWQAGGQKLPATPVPK